MKIAVLLYKHAKCQDVGFGFKQSLRVINRLGRPHAGSHYIGTPTSSVPQVPVLDINARLCHNPLVPTDLSDILLMFLTISTFARIHNYTRVHTCTQQDDAVQKYFHALYNTFILIKLYLLRLWSKDQTLASTCVSNYLTASVSLNKSTSCFDFCFSTFPDHDMTKV